MADDEKDVEVTFPEDYQAEELAGKDTRVLAAANGGFSALRDLAHCK